jgi:hypothetical protein
LEHAFRLKGLDPAANYVLRFEDATSEPVIQTGAALMEKGIRMKLSKPQSSEIVHIVHGG